MTRSAATHPTVLVTGGAKRLGQAVALHLARQKYAVALHYNQSKADAMKTAQQIHRLGARCELFTCDLGDEAAVKNLMPAVIKSMGHVDVLVNSASMFIPNRFGDEDMSLYKTFWDVNFKAPYILSCAFQRLAKRGHIINFIDTNVVKYSSRYADYLLTKKALGEFTKMAAVQWGPNIRVNGVSPGMILPPVNGQKDDRKARAQSIPLKKVGDPAYVLQAIQLLLDNEYMTGQIINVDGGEGLI